MTGHLLGAAGAVENRRLRAGDPRQHHSPTINYENPTRLRPRLRANKARQITSAPV